MSDLAVIPDAGTSDALRHVVSSLSVVVVRSDEGTSIYFSGMFGL